jgi:hypothetical protein
VTFQLEIGWDVARALLAEAALAVLSPELVYRGGDGNHDIGGPINHFGILHLLQL